MIPYVPIEIWERIIDHLWYEHESLQSCSLVCKQWQYRSRFHLVKRVHLQTRTQVGEMAKLVRTSASMGVTVEDVVITGGGKLNGEWKTIPHLGTFAAMLAGYLPHLRRLEIRNAKWRLGEIKPKAFIYLSSFTSVTLLIFHSVTFPNVMTFARMVCALPNVDDLECRSVDFSDNRVNVSALPRSPPTQLWSLNLHGPSSCYIIDVLIAAKIAVYLHDLCIWQPFPLEDAKRSNFQHLVQEDGHHVRRLYLTVQREPLGGISTQEAAENQLGLSHLTRLSFLSLIIGPDPTFDYDWLPICLSTISSSVTRHVLLTFDIDWNPESQQSRHILAKISEGICSQIDVLSRPIFTDLRTVEFRLWVVPSHLMVGETVWAEALPPQLPKLQQSGILRTSVHVYVD